MSRRLAGSRRRIEWIVIAAVLAAAPARAGDGERSPALGSLRKAAAAALAPAIEEPEAKLYEDEVPLRLSPPAADQGNRPEEYILEISAWDRAARGWASPEVRTVATGEDGRSARVLPADWLGESSSEVRRFRLRVRTGRDPIVWSAWRVFNARFTPGSSAAPPRASSPAEARSPEASPRLHLPRTAPPGASGPSPTVQAPERKIYEADVPIQILPPSGAAPSGYLVELSFYDNAAQNWSETITQTIEADPGGTLSATLPGSWLGEQAPGAVRWRLRAKVDGPDSPWSEWKMFGRRLAPAPRTPPEGQLRSAPTRPSSP